jgi:hypothetical protein
MRKRTKLGLYSALGATLLIWAASSNWPLAAAVGVGLGLLIFVFTHSYPHDIAPPADRRHENAMRRRAAQRQSS